MMISTNIIIIGIFFNFVFCIALYVSYSVCVVRSVDFSIVIPIQTTSAMQIEHNERRKSW